MKYFSSFRGVLIRTLMGVALSFQISLTASSSFAGNGPRRNHDLFRSQCALDLQRSNDNAPSSPWGRRDLPHWSRIAAGLKWRTLPGGRLLHAAYRTDTKHSPTIVPVLVHLDKLTIPAFQEVKYKEVRAYLDRYLPGYYKTEGRYILYYLKQPLRDMGEFLSHSAAIQNLLPKEERDLFNTGDGPADVLLRLEGNETLVDFTGFHKLTLKLNPDQTLEGLTEALQQRGFRIVRASPEPVQSDTFTVLYFPGEHAPSRAFGATFPDPLGHSFDEDFRDLVREFGSILYSGPDVRPVLRPVR